MYIAQLESKIKTPAQAREWVKHWLEKHKEIILNEHRSKFNLPLYIIMVLIILKYLHYNLGILPLNYYSKLKKFLTNSCYDNNKSEFIVLDV